MRFEIIGRNITVTDTMREKIEKKLSSLEKYLIIDGETTARVVTKVPPASQKIEVTIPTKVGVLRTEVENDDLYAAIDLAVDKLEDQIRRQKTRLSRRHRDSLAEAFYNEQAEEEEDIPVRTKTITVDEMDLDEAIMQMELSGHDFYLFRDEESGRIAVVYRRGTTGYGMIETTE